MAAGHKSTQTLWDKMEKGRAKPIFVGLVRPHPNDHNLMQYSSTPDASKWIDVPSGEIEGIDFLQDIQIGGSSIPLVRMQLRPMRQTVAPLFKALAEHHSVIPLASTLAALTGGPVGNLASAAPASPGPRRCGYVWTGSGYTYLCF